jgi:hypothetical protein
MAAHIQLARGVIVGILDAVRNRVLKFVLEIEAQAPDAGEVALGGVPISQERVTQIYNTNIWGGTNIAVGSSSVTQTAQEVNVGDLESLRRFLAGLGIEQADLNELEQAIRDDDKPRDTHSFGERVSAWIGKMTAKAASGAWKIAVPAAGNLLASAIRWYYGLP